MSSQTSRLVVLAIGVLLFMALDVKGLKLAFISSGTPSDLLQIASIVRAAYQRNHSATVLVDARELGGCKDVFGNAVCTPVICSQEGCQYKSADQSRALLAALRKRSFPPDVIVAAVFLYEADRISEHLGVPLVIVSSSSSNVPSIRSTSFHPLPFDMWGRFPLLNTVISAIRGFSASVWDLTSSGAPQDTQMARHIITQGIPGIDIVDPICPNVHPIGFFRGDNEVLAKSSFAGIDAYIESCRGRFIYASFLVESSVHGQQVYSALQAVANETNSCILWYMSSGELSSLRFRRSSEGQRVKVTDDTFAAPFYVLHRHNPIVVLSNNVKEIMYDAILAESPIVYVGSNRLSCFQLWNAGIAACASTPRTADVVSAILSVYNKSSVRERVRAARRMGFLMGGAQKAVEVTELAAAMGTGNMDFVCDQNVLLSPYGYDSAIALSISFVLGVLFFFTLRCCRFPLKW
ncbi:hypothetical protein Q4I32_007392 [Leishmania shawi]|uniref:Receptor ligand binding region domain-containing protein n=1 Tax=Leishmania shawi TaxID=5680 RepID=A0AAW3B9V6_9TRYP